jgi:hypothetical protein
MPVPCQINRLKRCSHAYCEHVERRKRENDDAWVQEIAALTADDNELAFENTPLVLSGVRVA